MNFEFAGLTDPGLMRDNNEDSVAVDAGQCVAVLADGMGGYNAGEIASAMAVTFVKAELTRWLSIAAPRCTITDVRHAVEACVVNANQSIYNAANANPQFSGMGTTLVVGVFDPRRVLLAHVGDSRCYLWRDGQLIQLTVDHSLLQEQLDAGLITPAQAKFATHKNLVTRALGVEEGVLVDILEHVPKVGDLYLVCSDGLTNMVDDEALARILSVPSNLQECAAALVRAANEAGGRDNISVILIDSKAESGATGFFSRVMRRA
jgi:PPM family protein phosphatase